MAEVETRPLGPRDAVDITRETITDESAFAELTRRYGRELHVHCYRMLAFVAWFREVGKDDTRFIVIKK